jgi:cysteine synthase
MTSIPLLATNVLDAIGRTPLVELGRLVRNRNLQGRLLAKLEFVSPGSSKKDRIATEMLRHARANGLLREGQSVVELTSGNTGTGLAIACAVLGHPFIAVMSKGNTVERSQMMRAFGAEVVLVDQAPGSRGGQVSGADLALVEQRVAELVEGRGAFRADQFRSQAAVDAHERTTGPELWRQANGTIDVFLDFVGTASTFTGVMRYLCRQNNKIRGYVVEPATAPILAGQGVTNASHAIQGGGYGKSELELPLFDSRLAHGYLTVTDEAAVGGARALAREEGIFGGLSSGAHCAAALDLLQDRERAATIAFLICDSGLKYLSTGLFQ